MHAPARPASTVVVLREVAGLPARVEVLMVKRNDHVAFMAGAYVFPGGRVDAADHAGAVNDDAAFRNAGVRELFEEANVRIAADALQLFAHWVTPEIEIRRYDTRFFLARMPEGQEAKHDDSETTAFEWLTPAEAIDRSKSGSIQLPPPTWTTLRQLEPFGSVDDVFAWARAKAVPRVMPGFHKDDSQTMLTLPGDPLFPTIPGWEVPEETRFVLEGGSWKPASAKASTSAKATADKTAGQAKIDRLITLFNSKSMDLPDGLFDRKTQFVLNGASFESLLSPNPNDPLVLMLARGPAGYRFAVKALQHAVPDVKIERGEGGLWLSGHLKGTGEPIDVVVNYSIKLATAGWVEVVDATIDGATLDKLREARLKP